MFVHACVLVCMCMEWKPELYKKVKKGGKKALLLRKKCPLPKADKSLVPQAFARWLLGQKLATDTVATYVSNLARFLTFIEVSPHPGLGANGEGLGTSGEQAGEHIHIHIHKPIHMHIHIYTCQGGVGAPGALGAEASICNARHRKCRKSVRARLRQQRKSHWVHTGIYTIYKAHITKLDCARACVH